MKLIASLLVLLSPISLTAQSAIFSHPLGTSNQMAFNQVQKQLSKSHRLSGHFVQTRHIQLLSAPLISKGHFTLSQTKGLAWYQTEPFKSKLLVTDARLVQQIADNPPTELTQKKQPVVFGFTKLFLSIFKGNTAHLKQYFKIYFQGNKQKWRLGLIPLGSPLNKAFKSIELSGGTYVSEVTINEANNNRMDIKFSDIKEQ